MKKLLANRFLKDNQGLETVEWLTIGAVIVALGVTTAYTVSTNAKAQGSNVASYITGINAPDSP